MVTDFRAGSKYKLALEYWSSRYSIIPIARDGSKRPAVAWKPYQSRVATAAEIDAWWGQTDDYGIGIVCGTASGGLEVIDFDCWQLLAMWRSLLPAELDSRLVNIETPTGWHVLYRCAETAGNSKLAMWEPALALSEQRDGHRRGTGLQPLESDVRIETRGEGGYIVAEGNPCDVHKSGLPYVHYCGPPVVNVETITTADRKLLWDAARTFDCRPKIEAPQPRVYEPASNCSGTEPWVWCDRHGPTIAEQLQRVGWTISGICELGYSVARPGKTFGTSGTVSLNASGEEVLTIFSTSAGILAPTTKPYQCYGRFALLAKLEFGDDRSAAAKHVIAMMGAR